MAGSARTIRFRDAQRSDVAAVIALLRDDRLGAMRETASDAAYLAAFDEMIGTGVNSQIVGLVGDRIVATYHLSIIPGLTLGATRRAQVEGVRVASDLRGQGLGEAMFQDVEARARRAGCGLIQLQMNTTRQDARRFYERLGFTASHHGFKRDLS